MNPETAFITGLIAGLFGSTHCLGMCGGIAGLLHSQIPNRQVGFALGFHGGRISSYMIIGLLATLIGLLPGQFMPEASGAIMRGGLGVMIISMALYIAMPGRFKDHIGELMAPLTRKLTPMFQKLLPVTQFDQAIGLGMLWGLLPCGLLYTMIASAVLLADPAATSAMILAFGLGTTPALLGTGMIALRFRSITNQHGLRWLAASVMLVAGLLVAFGPMLVQLIDHPWMHFLADCVSPR